MPLLPDAAVAGGIALAVFLLTLGLLVVFLENVPRRALLVLLLAAIVLAVLLVFVGEFGTALLPLAFAAAFVANGVFEWLTTR